MTKPISLNPFNQNQRKLIQFGIVFLLLVFFVVLYVIFKHNTPTKPSGVVLSDSKLQVFDQTYDHFDYPDRISVHYPYLLIIQPDKTLTTVYDLKKRQEKENFKQALLDYDGKNVVYNGKDTFFNNTDLGVLCSSAFSKSDQEILCATNTSTDTSGNVVVSINTISKLQKTVYQTINLITYVTVIKGNLYIGEMDTKTNENYLVTYGKKIKVQTPVNLIYSMNNQVYVASFKSVFTGNKGMFYEVGKGMVEKKSEGKLVVSQ